MTDERLAVAKRDEVVEAIQQMDENDLRFLNRLIVDRLKLIAQARSTAMLSRFSVGDRVVFRSQTGQAKFGVITRLNKKTASIITDGGEQWNVHPGYLTLDRADVIETPTSG